MNFKIYSLHGLLSLACLTTALAVSSGCTTSTGTGAANPPADSTAQVELPSGMPDNPDFHDAHFHLTNYIQEGISIEDYLVIMGDRVGRSALFGIPLQQTCPFVIPVAWLG